jgi:hypothetical protein
MGFSELSALQRLMLLALLAADSLSARRCSAAVVVKGSVRRSLCVYPPFLTLERPAGG